MDYLSYNNVGIVGTAYRKNYLFAVEGPDLTQKPESSQPAEPQPCSCTFQSLHSLTGRTLVRVKGISRSTVVL